MESRPETVWLCCILLAIYSGIAQAACNLGAISGYTVSSSSQSSTNPVTDVFKDNGWCAASDKNNEWVDIAFPAGFGAKGFSIGSTTVDETSHPSSVLVQYVPIGASNLQDFPMENQQPLIILLNNTGTSTLNLGTGIAVQKLRFVLQKYTGRACMKLEVTGCDVKDLCSPPCVNGGHCLAEDYCLCEDGFHGSSCETKHGHVTFVVAVINPIKEDHSCNAAPLGIFDGRVPQKDIIVSSEDPEYPKAQIGYNVSSPTSNKGWCASDNDPAPWVQIKFDEPKSISTINFYYINGPNQLKTFMRRFELQYIAPTDSARIFRTFADNIDSLNGTHAISVTMIPPVITDTIRIVSQVVEKKACFKLEMEGCDPSGLCQAGFCLNGGSCVGSNICKCPDGFLGNRCDQTKNDINTPAISFVNITQNKLVTTTFTFSVTGSVSIKQVNNTNVLIINGANSNIKIDKGTPGAECLNNIDNCQTGFTLSLDVNFGSLVDNTHIVSSGGDIAGYKGLALYYNKQSLTYIVTTANQIWSLTVHYVPILHVWQKFEITWNTNMGIGLFLNGNLLGTHGRPEPTTATQTAVLCIGCNPVQTSSVVVNMQILQIHTWTVSRTELVNAGIVVAPVVTTRRPVQTPPSTAQPTSTKQMTAVPTVATTCNQGAISGYTVSSSSQSSTNPVTDVFKDNGWCAASDKNNEWVDIAFPAGFGAKGFSIGSTTVDETSHPSSVLVQYVPIGASNLQDFPMENQQPLIILLNNTGTSTMNLGTGIAVQKLRFLLQSFTGRACMKLEVTGCDVKDLCSPPCVNGGHCLAEDYCLCEDGFHGSSCETKPCNAAPLGIFDGRVPQKDIIVSSEDPEYPKAQIGYNVSSPTSNKGWCASDNDPAPWVQIKFDEPKSISTINFYYINGPNQLKTFMRRFELQYIAPTDSARIFRTFADNIDSLNGTHAISVTMIPPVITDTIRIVSQVVEKKACFKLEMEGCDPSGLCQAGFCLNGGSCVGSNICKCPDGFLGNRCDQTKNDINTPAISFVNITQNKLVTTTFTFSVTGSVSIKQVNNTNVLIINGANSNIKIDKGTPGAECLNNIDNCQTGFTLSLDVNFGSLVDNTHIVSSGGDIAGYKGLALYYNKQSLTYIVTTANQIWSLTVHYVPILHVWQKFEITWNTNMGIGLFLNGNLLGTHGRPEPTTATQTAVLCIGCNPVQTSSVVVNMQILQIHTWTVSRTELVNAGIVVAPVVTTRRPVQTPPSTAQPTSTKQTTAVPTVATTTTKTTTPDLGYQIYNMTIVGIVESLLITPTFNFTVHGNPKLELENGSQTALVLDCSQDQYVELTDQGIPCLQDLNNCANGFTFNLEVNFTMIELQEKTYILSSGGDDALYNGMALYLHSNLLTYGVKKGTMHWAASANVKSNIQLNHWHKFEISWKEDKGILVLIDGFVVINDADWTPAPGAPGYNPVLIGKSPLNNYTSCMKVRNLFTWTTQREVLVDSGIVSGHYTPMLPTTTQTGLLNMTPYDLTFLHIDDVTQIVYTKHFLFQGHGQLSLPPNGDSILTLRGEVDQYLSLLNRSVVCLDLIDSCKYGFTIEISVQVFQATDKLFMFTSINNDTTGGVYLYYQNGQVYYGFRYGGKVWSGSVQYNILDFQWHSFMLSWSSTDGITLLEHFTPISQSPEPIHDTSGASPTTIGDLQIGNGYDIGNKRYTFQVNNLKIWPYSIRYLIDNQIYTIHTTAMLTKPSTKPPTTVTLATPTSPVSFAYWTFLEQVGNVIKTSMYDLTLHGSVRLVRNESGDALIKVNVSNGGYLEINGTPLPCLTSVQRCEGGLAVSLNIRFLKITTAERLYLVSKPTTKAGLGISLYYINSIINVDVIQPELKRKWSTNINFQIDLNTWYSVELNWSLNTGISLFINGILIKTESSYTLLSQVDIPLMSSGLTLGSALNNKPQVVFYIKSFGIGPSRVNQMTSVQPIYATDNSSHSFTNAHVATTPITTPSVPGIIQSSTQPSIVKEQITFVNITANTLYTSHQTFTLHGSPLVVKTESGESAIQLNASSGSFIKMDNTNVTCIGSENNCDQGVTVGVSLNLVTIKQNENLYILSYKSNTSREISFYTYYLNNRIYFGTKIANITWSSYVNYEIAVNSWHTIELSVSQATGAIGLLIDGQLIKYVTKETSTNHFPEIHTTGMVIGQTTQTDTTTTVLIGGIQFLPTASEILINSLAVLGVTTGKQTAQPSESTHPYISTQTPTRNSESTFLPSSTSRISKLTSNLPTSTTTAPNTDINVVHTPSNKQTTTTESKVVSTVSQQTSPNSVTPTIHIASSTVIHISPGTNGHFANTTGSNVDLTISPQTSTKGVTTHTHTSSSLVSQGTHTDSNKPITTTEAISDSTTLQQTTIRSVATNMTTTSEKQNLTTQFPISIGQIAFVNITANTLYTNHNTFTLHGSPVVVKTESGQSAIQLNASSGSFIKMDNTNVTCIGLGKNCDQGITVGVSLNLVTITQNNSLYILSYKLNTSSEISFYTYYLNNRIYFGTKLVNITWSSNVNYEIAVNSWHTIELSVSQVTGAIGLLIDGQLIKYVTKETSTNHFPEIHTTGLVIGQTTQTDTTTTVLIGGIQFLPKSSQILIDTLAVPVVTTVRHNAQPNESTHLYISTQTPTRNSKSTFLPSSTSRISELTSNLPTSTTTAPNTDMAHPPSNKQTTTTESKVVSTVSQQTSPNSVTPTIHIASSTVIHISPNPNGHFNKTTVSNVDSTILPQTSTKGVAPHTHTSSSIVSQGTQTHSNKPITTTEAISDSTTLQQTMTRSVATSMTTASEIQNLTTQFPISISQIAFVNITENTLYTSHNTFTLHGSPVVVKTESGESAIQLNASSGSFIKMDNTSVTCIGLGKNCDQGITVGVSLNLVTITQNNSLYILSYKLNTSSEISFYTYYLNNRIYFGTKLVNITWSSNVNYEIAVNSWHTIELSVSQVTGAIGLLIDGLLIKYVTKETSTNHFPEIHTTGLVIGQTTQTDTTTTVLIGGIQFLPKSSQILIDTLAVPVITTAKQTAQPNESTDPYTSTQTPTRNSKSTFLPSSTSRISELTSNLPTSTTTAPNTDMAHTPSNKQTTTTESKVVSTVSQQTSPNSVTPTIHIASSTVIHISPNPNGHFNKTTVSNVDSTILPQTSTKGVAPHTHTSSSIVSQGTQTHSNKPITTTEAISDSTTLQQTTTRSVATSMTTASEIQNLTTQFPISISQIAFVNITENTLYTSHNTFTLHGSPVVVKTESGESAIQLNASSGSFIKMDNTSVTCIGLGKNCDQGITVGVSLNLVTITQNNSLYILSYKLNTSSEISFYTYYLNNRIYFGTKLVNITWSSNVNYEIAVNSWHTIELSVSQVTGAIGLLIDGQLIKYVTKETSTNHFPEIHTTGLVIGQTTQTDTTTTVLIGGIQFLPKSSQILIDTLAVPVITTAKQTAQPNESTDPYISTQTPTRNSKSTFLPSSTSRISELTSNLPTSSTTAPNTDMTHTPSNKQTTTTESKVVSTVSQQTSPNSVTSTIHIASSIVIHISPNPNGHFNKTTVSNVDSTISPQTSTKGVTPHTHTSSSIVSQGTQTHSNKPITTTEAISDSTTLQQTTTRSVATSMTTTSEKQNLTTQFPISIGQIAFVNITANALYTNHNTFTLHGNPVVVKTESGESAIQLNASSGSFIKMDNISVTCIGSGNNCDQGVTIGVSLNLVSIKQNNSLYILSYKSHASNSISFYAYYLNKKIYFGSKIANLTWSANVSYNLAFNTMHTIELSVSQLMGGIGLLIDGKLVKYVTKETSTDHFPHVQTIGLVIGQTTKTDTTTTVLISGIQFLPKISQVLVESFTVTMDATTGKTTVTPPKTTTTIATTTATPVPTFQWNLTSIPTTNVIVGPDFNLTIHGTPTSTDAGVELNGTTQYIEIGSLQCLINPFKCTQGLSVQFTIDFKFVQENTFVLTSGGQLPNGVGIAVIYRYGKYQFIVSTTTHSWYATCGKNVLKPNKFHVVMLSWHANIGLELIVDNTQIEMVTQPVTHEATVVTNTTVYFGKQPTDNVKFEYVIQTVSIWYAHVDILVTAGLCTKPERPEKPTTTVKPTPKPTTKVPTAKPTTSPTTKYTGTMTTKAPQCPVGCVAITSTPSNPAVTATSKRPGSTSDRTPPVSATSKPPIKTDVPTTQKPTTTPTPTSTPRTTPTTTERGAPNYNTVPTMTATVTGNTNQAFLVCAFNKPSEAGIEMTIALIINEKRVLVETVAGSDGIALFSVAQVNMNLYGAQIRCSLVANYIGNSHSTQVFFSNTYIPSFTVTPAQITVTEGHPGKHVTVQSTAPPQLYCCTGCRGQCQVHVVGIFKYDRKDQRCNSNYISQAVIESAKPPNYNKEICGFALTVTNWKSTNQILVVGTLDNRRDGTQRRDLKIEVNVYNQPPTAQITITPVTYVLSTTVKVTILDNYHSSYTCKSINDPHLLTFDGAHFNNMREGQFVMFRHKELPFEVRSWYQKCSKRSHATCNCGVAVQSGDDVITVIGCNTVTSGGHHPGQGHGIGLILQQLFGSHGNAHGHHNDQEFAKTPMTIQIYKNGELTPGTYIRRFGCGQKYEIELPTGMIVTVQQSYKPFINIWIKASSMDREKSTGLCGDFNGRRDEWSGNKGLDRFISEHVAPNNPFFNGVGAAALITGSTYCSCVENKGSVCSHGLGVMQCSRSRYDVTNALLQQAKAPVLATHRRKRQVQGTEITATVAPDGLNLTESEMFEKCRDYIMGSTVTQNCQPILTTNLSQQVDNCVHDYNATESFAFATSALSDIVVDCVESANTILANNDTDGESNDTDVAIPIPDNLDDILAGACVEECGDNGACQGGVCVCDDGFSGVTCNISSDTKPIVSIVPYLCDVSDTLDCKGAVVYGDNFVNSTKLTCHYEYIKVSESVHVTQETGTIAAEFMGINQVMCQIPRLQSVNIRISNNGNTLSDSTSPHIVYDSRCYDCSIRNDTTYVPGCTRTDSNCEIAGQCYLSGWNKEGDICRVCNPAVNDTEWSLNIEKTECTAQPLPVFTDNEDDQHKIIALAVVSAVLAAILLLLIVYIVKSRSSSKSKKEFGAYQVTSEPQLHRDEFYQTNNPTYVSDNEKL